MSVHSYDVCYARPFVTKRDNITIIVVRFHSCAQGVIHITVDAECQTWMSGLVGLGA